MHDRFVPEGFVYRPARLAGRYTESRTLLRPADLDAINRHLDDPELESSPEMAKVAERVRRGSRPLFSEKDIRLLLLTGGMTLGGILGFIVGQLGQQFAH